MEKLAGAGHEIALAVTRPPKRRGRRSEASPTPVEVAALERGIPVDYEPARAAEAGAELGVVVAYGRILRADLLDALAMVNLHFSLLPRWRGAAPVERAILAGDDRTGVCLMQVEAGLDTGGVYRRVEVDIGADETAAQLTERLARLGAGMLVEALAEGLGDPEPQTGEATYAAKLTADELRLEWSQPAEVLYRVVRVGRAWTTHRGRRLLVLDARPGVGGGVEVPTGSGRLTLLRVQPEGRRPMAATDWARGVGGDLQLV